MRKRLIALLIAATTWTSALFAVPAKPGTFTITQSNGQTITVELHGDEFHHYATTSDGYNIIEGEDGIYRYARLSGTRLVPTQIVAKNPADRGAEDRSILNQIRKGVPSAVVETVAAQRRKASGMTFAPVEPEKRGTTRATRATEKEKYIVLLVNFSDKEFLNKETAQQSFTNLLNQEGYNDNNATGSVKDYFYDNSNGAFEPEFDVYGPYTLPQTMSYYGANDDDGDDMHPDSMIIQACRLADADVDYTQYATDGEIRNVYVFYAGYNEAEGGSAETIWPHSSYRSGHRFDGVALGRYACSSELRGRSGSTTARIGTFCHEFGHVLGLPDFYDVKYNEVNPPVTLRNLSLMCSGNYNNNGNTPPAFSAFERYYLGWTTPEEIEQDGDYTLKPVYDGKSYMIKTSINGEFFVLENRNNANKWDAGISNGGSGLIVYHVDMSNNYISQAGTTAEDTWHSNTVNTYSSHECMKVVRAIKTETVSDWFYPGASSISSLNSDNGEYLCWAGIHNGYNLTGITYAEGDVRFTLKSSESGAVAGTISNVANDKLSNVKVFLYKLEESQATDSNLKVLVRAKATRGATEFTATTDAMGGFKFVNLPQGEYELFSALSSYDDYSEVIKVSSVGLVKNIIMTHPAEAGSKRVSWAGAGVYIIGLKSNDISKIGALYEYADAGIDAGNIRLSGFNFYLDGATETTISIYKNKSMSNPASVPTATQKVQVTKAGWTYVDLTAHNITMAPGEYVYMSLDLTNYMNAGGNIRMDAGQTVTQKGGYFYSSGSWFTNSTGTTYYSWLMGAYFSNSTPVTGIALDNTPVGMFTGESARIRYTLTPAEAGADLKWHSTNEEIATIETGGIITAMKPGTTTVYATSGTIKSNSVEVTVTGNPNQLICTVYQNDAIVSWMPLGYNGVWSVTYGRKTNSSSIKTVEVSGNEIYLSGLMSGQTYDISVSPVTETEGVGTRTDNFTTGSASGPFAYMHKIDGTYNQGDKIPLIIMDVQSTLKSIVWTLDGATVTPPTVTPASGRHTLTAIISTSDGQQEKIIKTITVK